jgi:predicted butyrate kinase (DUF1464 family)
MPRVAGADPGTSSLDLVILEKGAVADQCRFTPEELQADISRPIRWLVERGPLDLVAGPSGYGLPLVRAEACSDRHLDLMVLVRPDDKPRRQGVARFASLVRAFRNSGLPVVFLPSVIHLPTVPIHRKINRIDLGTADKVCVAALAIHLVGSSDFCLIEMGSAFTACVVVQSGQIVDGLGGTSGPVGGRSLGAWDGEIAYLFSPLAKEDLFRGGILDQVDDDASEPWFRESLVRAVAGLQAVTPFRHLLLAGRLLESNPGLSEGVSADLAKLGTVVRLGNLASAWVKHAAQGAALLADGLAGGTNAALVDRLRLREAAGTVLDWLRHPRTGDVQTAFLG